MFNTTVLKVDVSSIKFGALDTKPIITDEETKHNIELAAKVLTESNDVVGFPTETVYGLGGSALSDESVKGIYKAKNRPSDNPLIVHISSIDQLKRRLLPEDYEIPHIYDKLIQKFWPGPLTILLPVHDGSPISKYVTANQDTFAVRMPAHPVARSLIAISDTPLAAPLANASTRPSPTLASHVLHDLQGRIPYILDGGACDVGVESTVVDGLLDPPMLLRPGGVSLEEIRQFGGDQWKHVILSKKTAGKLEAVRTPGMKYKHYSPSAEVVLFTGCGNGKKAITQYISQNNLEQKKLALLRARNFGSNIHPGIIIERSLGSTGQEISRNLFRMLRDVDEDPSGVDVIFVEGTDETNEGLAIMNRLSKAAAVHIKG
ncbi:uncharacterized protein KQ657_000779 [Scheffersomyces spartinae]|uniref:Threonylcarbamoyl-AMP synthase n=1 Tax=Scheffersomyces spartinae TaxID=45513 RepID=A0A9P8AHH7_9ASCO|nr:uncharacterized protein KQ657_000779 [Scheffersomyces spartinae]KAG7193362.1 hypothetical protein KQ657_000779 [Scheffersomyces spartinae]